MGSVSHPQENLVCCTVTLEDEAGEGGEQVTGVGHDFPHGLAPRPQRLLGLR